MFHVYIAQNLGDTTLQPASMCHDIAEEEQTDPGLTKAEITYTDYKDTCDIFRWFRMSG